MTSMAAQTCGIRPSPPSSPLTLTLAHPAACQGERINLTWRTIVKHLDGSDECRGMVCDSLTRRGAAL